MNPQLSPDARVDQILTALRTTEPPAGLEARIAARIAQARSQSTATPSLFANILNAVKRPSVFPAPAQLYAASAVALFVAISTFTLLHHHPATQSQLTTFRTSTPTRTTALAEAFTTSGIAPQASHAIHIARVSAPVPPSPTAQDPDQLALAETLAPSRPGPPLPLTTQEQTLVAATRPGQPIQLAELDLARAPQIRTEAEARRNADIERYVKSLLAPFATADSLQPTKFSEPREMSQAVPAPILVSSTN